MWEYGMDEWMIFYMNKIKIKESKKSNFLKLRADKTENNLGLCPQLFLSVYLI